MIRESVKGATFVRKRCAQHDAVGTKSKVFLKFMKKDLTNEYKRGIILPASYAMAARTVRRCTQEAEEAPLLRL